MNPICFPALDAMAFTSRAELVDADPRRIIAEFTLPTAFFLEAAYCLRIAKIWECHCYSSFRRDTGAVPRGGRTAVLRDVALCGFGVHGRIAGKTRKGFPGTRNARLSSCRCSKPSPTGLALGVGVDWLNRGSRRKERNEQSGVRAPY